VFAIEVRAARDSDVEAIAAIYVDAAREGWADFLGESNMDALQPPLARFRAELGVADARQQMLVAERGGRVIGFAGVRAN